MVFGNSSGLLGDGDFEDVLCKVDGDDRILHFGLLRGLGEAEF